MKIIAACLAVLLGVSSASAGSPALRQARERLLKGNYAEAREQYEALLKKGEHAVAATLGLCRAWHSEGNYREALDILDSALKSHGNSADLHAFQADLLFQRGRWDEADKAANHALTLSRNSFLAHWVLARLHRDRGDFKKANDEFLWFVRAYSNADITDPEDLLLVGLSTSERARWDSRLSDQFEFVLGEVYGEALKRDKDFWWAEYYAGALYLEKYNYKLAYRALDKALQINPRAAEALTAKGIAALSRFELKDADLFAERALKINPSLTEALRLKADLHLAAGELDAAGKVLEQARAVNPREEATLARIAACFLLSGKDADFKTLVKEVEKHNPKAGLFYAELAHRLEERRLHESAERYYQRALELRPHLAPARNHLGLLYMRLGREDDARPILEKAAVNDKFNVRVFNSLKVLDHLDTYRTIKTPHFELRHDPKHDQVLAAFMAKYLEEIYEELAKKFQYRPKGPFLIEVFNNHDMFSGRVVALPDLHTIGACTGRLVAMVSTRDRAKVIAKPFNWVRVLRHELVHVFNLEQTNFKVPHWFTEGVAVSLEGFPMTPSWYPLLQERVQSGELFNLDNILLGFVRPNSQEEWQLAYLQSFLYVQYLEKTHGEAAIGGFLKAFSEGLSTDAALERVCKVKKADFEKGYRKHLQALVVKFAGKASEKVLSFTELKKAQARDPANADLTAQLAERYLLLGNTKDAKQLAEQALDHKKNHPLASYVQARLHLAERDKAKAVAVLEAAVDAKAPDLKVLGLLGKLQFEDKQFAQAALTLERARAIEPHETQWLVELVKIYKQSGNEVALRGVLKDFVPLSPDDLDARRILAELLAKAGDHAGAERYARQALEIEVLDTASQRLLEAALKAQNKNDELAVLRKLLQP
jgi:tetratricopeptide (TPR) repeat protein